MKIINSKEWWNDFFKETWENNEGRGQSECFMKTMFLNLPDDILIDIDETSKKLLDWGCALGDGTNIIKEFYNNKNVYGLDFSKTAIEKALSKYPNIYFKCSTLEKINETFDVILNSNCLEHFDKPLEVLESHLEYALHYYICLVPFMEKPLSEHHKSYFDEMSFPNDIDNFNKIFQKVIRVNNKFWPGDQILVVYKRKIIDNSSSVEIWDKVSEGYNEEISETDIEIANYIDNILSEFQVDKNASIIELGSGSGHISLALKRKGYQDINLFDFSQIALDKSKNLFESNEYHDVSYIKGDLKIMDSSSVYDISFNSGVMEHFTNEETALIIENIYNITKKYYICLVPNATSIPYLFMRRFRMIKGTWDFGIEYLRTDYEKLFEKAGFQIRKIDYVGKNFMKYFMREALEEKYEELGLDFIFANEKIELKENNYLKIIVCEKV